MDIIESYPAHIREVNGDVKVQESRDHCCKTAEYARADLQSISLGNAAFLAGLLHDCGKFTDDFRKYICSAGIAAPETASVSAVLFCRILCDQLPDGADCDAHSCVRVMHDRIRKSFLLSFLIGHHEKT